jgi:hypothetical protein
MSEYDMKIHTLALEYLRQRKRHNDNYPLTPIEFANEYKLAVNQFKQIIPK